MDFELKFKLADLTSNFLSFFVKYKKNSVLLYHSVDKMNSKNYNLDTVNLDSFLNQMKILSSSNFYKRLAPLDLNLNKIGSISVTFDDGYIDNINFVYPIISKYNIPVTIFICKELIGQNGYLNKKDIEFLSKQKNIIIGSHSFSHKPLGNLSIPAVKEELVKSKYFLEDITNTNIELFSYPYGSYNKKILELLQDINIYKIACCSISKTFKPDNISKFLIPRIPIWYLDNNYTFINKLNSNWDWTSFFTNK